MTMQTSRLEEKVYSNLGNMEVLRVVPCAASTVLDVGCGAGSNARILVQRGKIVDGVTLSQEEAHVAATLMREVWVYNLEDGLPPAVQADAYDCILCSHVLEHIVYPDKLLADIRSALKTDGRLIVALPNLLYHQNRLQLLVGRFDYAGEGIMDNTHVRWYTFASAQRLLARHGFAVENAFGEGRFPMPGLRRFVPEKTRARLDEWAGRKFPGLCGWQMIFVAHKQE